LTLSIYRQPVAVAVHPKIAKKPDRTGPGNTCCDQCGRYCELLSSVLRELLEVHHFAMSTASENQWSFDMCRASTFNLLYEAAVIKEGGLATQSPWGNKGECAKAMEDTAREELQCLEALPPSSHKWTWGEQLTKADVLGLARSRTRPGKIHSGYDISLRGSKNSGDDSFAPSLPTSHGRYDAVLEDILPDASLASPSYFADFRHCLYDPLSLKVPDSDSESPSTYRHRGLLPGIPEHLASAPAPAPAMPPSAPSPPYAPVPSPPGQESSAPGLSSPPAPVRGRLSLREGITQKPNRYQDGGEPIRTTLDIPTNMQPP
jgi:hypothetical protein